MSDTEYLYQASGRQYEIVKKTAKLVFYKASLQASTLWLATRGTGSDRSTPAKDP
jgi:hypothetical protein